MEKQYLRIIDANINRAKEALRISEDISRFVLEDKSLTRRFKRCRHDLTQIILKFPVSYKKLLFSRNASGDVGNDSRIQDGRRKPDCADVMVANLKRSQEATRVLEEFSKIISPRSSASFQKLRFSLYELEKRSLQKF